jgi:hypothetical protein
MLIINDFSVFKNSWLGLPSKTIFWEVQKVLLGNFLDLKCVGYLFPFQFIPQATHN